MPNVFLASRDIVPIKTGPTGDVCFKRAKDISSGDYIWCFEATSYRPTLSGHFAFHQVIDAPTVTLVDGGKFRWFNKIDGPRLNIPNDWKSFQDGGFESSSTRHIFNAFGFPGHVHDLIPKALGRSIFDCFASAKLTEEVSYFLGAFAMRPQTYVVGSDTWGIFGTRLNIAGEFGVNNSAKVGALRQWLQAYRDKLTRIATKAWGPSNFLVEQHGARIGLPDISLPTGHQTDNLVGGTSPVGVAIHAPIASNATIGTDGHAGDENLEIIQFWYSCLRHFLLERSSPSVKKAFVLGAMDTVSNADKDRKTAGLDWPERYAGEFPFYSIMHSVGKELLPTWEGEATQNPRFTEGRLRGRIARAKLWDIMENLGFMSELRATRAQDYDNSLSSLELTRFPHPNCLSVTMGVDVLTVENVHGKGSSESDLLEQRVFALSEETKMRLSRIPVASANLFAGGSLPLGSIFQSDPVISTLPTRSDLRLASSTWEDEALDHIQNINRLLPTMMPPIAADRTFEFLVAALASRLPGCCEAWVVPRPEDNGVDVGANMDLGGELGNIRAIFQAKLQTQNVGRRIIDMLRGSLFREEASIGYVISNSRFTMPARRSAEKDYPEIRLIDGSSLVRLLLEYEVGLFRRKAGRIERIYLDLTFFQKLRDLTAATLSTTGRIVVYIDDAGLPKQLTT